MKPTTALRTAGIEGIVRSDDNTKRLLRAVRPGEIAVIRHADLDEAAASGLLAARVKAVVNAERTVTGTFPNEGPAVLLRGGVPVYEIEPAAFGLFQDGERVVLHDDSIVGQRSGVPCRKLTYEQIGIANRAAERNFGRALLDFAGNTIMRAYEEMGTLCEPIFVPPLRKPMASRLAVVVARGNGYREDLAALRPLVADKKPVWIAVDGGADAMIELGCVPDYIVGDMDSVSDAALRCGAQLLVHAYADGRAPGLARIERLGLAADVVVAPGTSEDAALRIAFEQGAERIVAVGAHSSPIDFLEKGRAGMASTLLTRMLIGRKLIDARGASLWLLPAKPMLSVVSGAGLAAEGGAGS